MKIFLSILFLVTNVATAMAADNSTTLRIHGSNTVGADLVPELIQDWLNTKGYAVIKNQETAKEERLMSAFNADGNEIKVEIHSHGSSTAFADLAAGKADLGMASRPIKNKELDALKFLGPLDAPGSEYVIALDGLSIIVHPNNQLHQIQLNELRNIFSGKISDWSQLGLPKGKIKVHARDDNSGTYDTFKTLVLGENTSLVANAKRYESNTLLSAAVAGDANAIGFVGLAYVRNAKALAVADTGANSIYPTPFNVSTEDYALSRRLFLYVPSISVNPLAKEFAEFALTRNGQDIADAVGFVSQNIVLNKPPLPTDVPDEYKALTLNAQRLSVNVRFRPGYVTLDNKAIRDVKRLIDFMERPENHDRKLMLFGFADAKEDIPLASLALSVNRADTVADYLIANGIGPFAIRGYGQAMPVTNNETDHGRHYNRRVEVWIE